MNPNNNKEQKSTVIKIPKAIIYAGRFLQLFSKKWAANFASKLFITPVKFPVPNRELPMLEAAYKSCLHVENIDKEIVTYTYGSGTKRVLLVHGWSGRGTQLIKIADELLAKGYQTISFDAPAHGKSKGKTTMMSEFISSIHAINNAYGPFEYAIGHSLGGISLLNAVKQGLKIKKLVTIGAGNSITDICDIFIKNLELKQEVSMIMKQGFDDIFDENIENYSSYMAAKDVTIPVLVIHDKDDEEIPFESAVAICKELQNCSTYFTEDLGHRKILGNKEVIDTTIAFLN
ncbi:MAG: alpha/beta hydrolase [Flavobacteriaceae bacterium]|nr:alpha/beta hydrolase [Flavobacteriaceae bacterium]